MPTLKELEDAFPGKGDELLKLINGDYDPEQYATVANWIRQCYNRPNDTELVMKAIDEVIEGYGTEAIFGDDPRWPDLEYVNMGDPYVTTIMYDYRTDEYIVGCWGDWLEKYEAEKAEEEEDEDA
jgi:hypothetical protein